MKKQLSPLLLLLPFFLMAQKDYKGIKFEDSLTWEQVKAKAKTENKYIFLDCYATWCGPCKMMDRNVYPSDKVGDFLNSKFISIKVQMDSTAMDSKHTRRWYTDAQKIMHEFLVSAFPSFLFFSPDGIIVHRDVGYRNEDDFITLASTASNPQKQYAKLLTDYQQGKRDTALMKQLARLSRLSGKGELAIQIANDYLEILKGKEPFSTDDIFFLKEFSPSEKVQQLVSIYRRNYIEKLDEKEFYTKEYIEFIHQFPESLFPEGSKGKFFKLFYSQAEKVDKIMDRKGLSTWVIDYVITKEEINDKLWQKNKPFVENPDWEKISATIRKQYKRNIAERIILEAQLRWYGYKQDWPMLAKYNIEKIEKYGLDTAGLGAAFTNDMIWEVIFLHNNEKAIIKKGIEFMEQIVKVALMPANFDTYANLLYKSGEIEKAIVWEEKAVKLEEEFVLKQKINPDNVYKETLEKMRRGIPTWPIK